MYCYLNPASTNHDLSYEHQQQERSYKIYNTQHQDDAFLCDYRMNPNYNYQCHQQDGVYLGDHRLNPDTNYYHHRHQQQDGVFLGDHRLKPDTNYYHRRRQQEGVNLGDYHMPNQRQPKRQRHSAWDRYSRSYEEAGEISENVYEGGYNTNPRLNYYYHKQQQPPRPWKPFFPSPISSEQTISEEESVHPFGVNAARIIADGTKLFESGLAFSRPPTVEEMLTYNREVEESDGFDVTDLPDVFLGGSIRPINISKESSRNRCETVAQIAIAAFNAKYEHSKGALKLEKLVKAMCQGAGGIIYYLTFDATNVAKKSTKTYQAKVLGPVRGNEVLSFRRQGSKKWYWNNSC